MPKPKMFCVPFMSSIIFHVGIGQIKIGRYVQNVIVSAAGLILGTEVLLMLWGGLYFCCSVEISFEGGWGYIVFKWHNVF